ncbi:MAG TPA: DUF1549 domain-containing protein, partial [Planctomycetaceae bacterium]|nr:DUF1549 domain-containing protein [Planctomycetaceae bacterium]
MRILWTLALGAIVVAAPSVLVAAEGLAILPGKIELSGRAARQRLVLERTRDGRHVGQVTDAVEFTSNRPEIVKIDGDMALPVANGQATITAKSGNATATAEVNVGGMDQPHAWSFRNHVESVLAKTGCNSGACHGALVGKGGFKLTLRGYDPDTDFQTITRQARGRRIEPDDPGRSLLIAKPSGAIPHKGGLRFEVDSLEYRVVAEWIAQGANPPTAEDARLERLEILPEVSTHAPGDSQQLLVLAHFSDGHTEDVTRWAKYTSANETVANVDDQGQVKLMSPGEGAVSAWYQSRIVIARVAVPYKQQVAPEVFAREERRNFIDDMVLAKLQSLNIPPSPPASDAEFLRRAYLDTIGTLPTPEEARAFLAENSADKRDKLIDALLARPEFVDYWTYKWSDLLLVNGKLLRPNALKAYSKFIRESVAANKPWDVMVREILTSKGNSFENGATNFFALHQDPQEMTEHACVAFLGLSINCARCHNHPLEKWTNNQYYGMANLFARVRAKGWGGDVNGGDGNRTLYVATEGDLIQPLTGRAQAPTPLDGDAIPMDSPEDRRIPLAAWMTSPENPYFARAITNRVWANFFGVGLVEAIDDLRTSNPASNEELLSRSADFLIEQKFDLKPLMRLILQSRAYQRSSLPLAENKNEMRFYSRYYPKRLMAEVLLDAISQATAAPSKFKDYPDGTRALQLADSAVDSYFLKTFGRPERVITCECERSAEPTMVQVLHISNGDTINQKLEAKGNRIEQLLAKNLTNEQIVEEAYLASLARLPTDGEKSRLVQALGETSGEDRRMLIEDLFW